MTKKMRDAAADLEFEEAARLRDEIKRLEEKELLTSEDALAKTWDGQESVGGKAMRKARGRKETGSTGDSKGSTRLKTRARKNTLDEMTVGRTEIK
jgi:excinuclease ABC subunit B